MEGNRQWRIVRRSFLFGSDLIAAQIVLLLAQGIGVASIAEVTFTGADQAREVVMNFNADGFDVLYPKYASGRSLMFSLPQRRKIKKVALSHLGDHALPFRPGVCRSWQRFRWRRSGR